jgi:hypothetical protein
MDAMGAWRGVVEVQKKERSQVTTIIQIQTYHFFLPFFLPGFLFRLFGQLRLCFLTLTGFEQAMMFV